VCAVEITPDGARVVLALVGGDVEVCDAVTGARVLRIPSRAAKRAMSYGGFGARCAAVSPDGRAVAVSARHADDARVRVFSLDDGALRGESKEADGVIDEVRWSPDGARLLTVGFRAREVRVWRVEALRR
jgi:WD40 repeat protein